MYSTILINKVFVILHYRENSMSILYKNKYNEKY